MEEKLVDKIRLENGLTLELYDRSRRVAGDRWLVYFVARVQVPVRKAYLESMLDSRMTFESVRRAVGDSTAYVREKKSNFVDEKEKDEEFRRLKESFLKTSLGYLSNPDFAGKLIMKTFQESQGMRVSWKPQ
ncbi:MAG: hypothetical protein JRI36_08875 [Deltaproteobacteria bacterium]|nr:hypothetical protein [Deltaproteobacteria bacterium]